MVANVTKTVIRLADDRELLYFDEKPGVDRSQPDRRDFAATHTTSEIRYDVLVDQWVIVASHRQTRTHLPPTHQCPLCPSAPGRPTEIPADDYDVVVFENRFPSLSHGVQTGVVDLGVGLRGDGAFLRRPGIGRCEVVCFTADHNASFGSLSEARVRTVIDALAERTAALSALPGVEQVFCFENRGEEIGVTLHHPHGQIYAVPVVTPRTRTMLEAARRHAHRTGGRSLYADVLAAERAAGERVVAGHAHWTAYVPAAARWPFEVHVAPHRRLPDLAALSAPEREALAPVYLEVLRRFDGLFDRPMPYIAAWHQAPVRTDRELGYLHLQVFSIRRAADKLKYLAGSESAMGVFINDIRPERAAELLRNVTPSR